MSTLADAFQFHEQAMDPQLTESQGDFLQDTSVGSGTKMERTDQPALKVEIPDSEAAQGGAEGEELADLFGDDDDEKEQDTQLSTPVQSAPESDAEALSASELKHRQELEYEENEGPDDTIVELKHAVLSIPNLPVPTSSDGNYWVIRMPNFVKLDPKPFHPDSYVGPEANDDVVQGNETARERTMSIKLEVENTIRWQWAKDELGQDRRQSNSRIVRWSDGSLSLLLGKELFDINQAIDTSASVPRQSVAGSQSQSQSQLNDSQSTGAQVKNQGLTYLVAQHKRPGILQAEAPVTGYMSLRPTGMQSETHRMLVRAVGQKHNKVARLRMAPDPMVDPERERIEMAKQLSKTKQRKVREDDGFGGRKRRYALSKRRTSDPVWSDEEPGEGVFNDTDEDEDDHFGSPSKKTRDSRSDRKGGGEYQTDGFVVADPSDEEEGESDASPRRRRKRTEDDSAVPDDLDEIDAKIARQERDKKRTKPAKAGSSQDEELKEDKSAVEMDVESEDEEDEEDFKVRRGGAGSRKKRAITMDDDDDDE